MSMNYNAAGGCAAKQDTAPITVLLNDMSELVSSTRDELDKLVVSLSPVLPSATTSPTPPERLKEAVPNSPATSPVGSRIRSFVVDIEELRRRIIAIRKELEI